MGSCGSTCHASDMRGRRIRGEANSWAMVVRHPRCAGHPDRACARRSVESLRLARLGCDYLAHYTVQLVHAFRLLLRVGHMPELHRNSHQLVIAQRGRASDADMFGSAAPVQCEVFDCFVTFPIRQITFDHQLLNLLQERISCFEWATIVGAHPLSHVRSISRVLHQ